ncbi:unnamed protein product, partial [marine sediment metagenome]
LYWKGGGTWEGTGEYWLDTTEYEIEKDTTVGHNYDWQYTDVPNWDDQKYYSVRAKGRDKAENEQVIIASATFMIDASAPQSWIYMPQHGAQPDNDDGGASEAEFLRVQGKATAGTRAVT